MRSLAFLVVLSFLFAFVITPLLRSAAIWMGAVDKPDSGRKTHARPLPRVGGIGILLAYVGAIGLLMLLPSGGRAWAINHALPLLWHVGPGTLIVVLVGLADDLWGLRPWQKIAGQFAAAVVVVWSGVLIHQIAYHAPAYWISVAATILWLTVCSNAFNLIDGVDGLATGVALFATLTTLVSALIGTQYPLALVTAPLLGALAGFLRYNFSPASIFLGDCGSLSVGFLLGCFAVIWSDKSATLLGMTAPIIAMAIPLLDTGLAVFRRVLRRQPIFAGDLGHMHHRLLARGFTTRRIASLFYASAGVLAALSVLMSNRQLGGFVIVAFCAVVWFAIRYLRYDEFDIARRWVVEGVLRGRLNGNVHVTRFEQAIHAASTVDECWKALLNTSRAMGLSAATLRCGDKEFIATLVKTAAAECWTLSVLLDGAGYVVLSVPVRPTQVPAIIAPLATSLRTVLAPRLSLIKSQSTSLPRAQHSLTLQVSRQASKLP
jgi:UDP-GlcNAc:undecaprenyl-phosphate GlcNAc-1-phosphate transferase